MAASMANISRARFLHHRTLNRSLYRLISASPFLSQEPQLQEALPSASPLPPSPSSGSPFYQENWRNPSAGSDVFGGHSLVPAGQDYANARIMAFSQTLDLTSLMDTLAEWILSQQWPLIKQVFEFWIRSLDSSGKLNRPDVNLYNYYLRANHKMGASAGELLDLVAQMQEYEISPNTASYNLVLHAMHQAREDEAAAKLLDRMLLLGCMPDGESYNLVVDLLLMKNQIDSVLKYLDMLLKSGYMISYEIYAKYVQICVNTGRLDLLALIIEKCKKTDQNKDLSPKWKMCNYIAEIALQADHTKLAFFSLEFLARWIARGANERPIVLLSIDEGLVVSSLCTAGRTFDSTLVDASWSVLRRSLRQKKAPNPETYLAKIYAYASIGNLQRAFSTLNELETAYGNSEEVDNELFSPFTSLCSLVTACCKNGFSTLDSVYLQLENLSNSDPPYKSVAALNCVILGCANIWDLDRAYETFEAITEKIGLTPDIHSYNALMCAFGKVKKTEEACGVFNHFVSLGVKPNATSYALLVDAHLANRDQKAALSVIVEMVDAGSTPSKDMLKKVRRRCSRELDFSSEERLQSLAQQLCCPLGGEGRREILYRINYGANYVSPVNS